MQTYFDISDSKADRLSKMSPDFSMNRSESQKLAKGADCFDPNSGCSASGSCQPSQVVEVLFPRLGKGKLLFGRRVQKFRLSDGGIRRDFGGFGGKKASK